MPSPRPAPETYHHAASIGELEAWRDAGLERRQARRAELEERRGRRVITAIAVVGLAPLVAGVARALPL